MVAGAGAGAGAGERTGVEVRAEVGDEVFDVPAGSVVGGALFAVAFAVAEDVTGTTSIGVGTGLAACAGGFASAVSFVLTLDASAASTGGESLRNSKYAPVPRINAAAHPPAK